MRPPRATPSEDTGPRPAAREASAYSRELIKLVNEENDLDLQLSQILKAMNGCQ
jgi:hypothetical protein